MKTGSSQMGCCIWRERQMGSCIWREREELAPSQLTDEVMRELHRRDAANVGVWDARGGHMVRIVEWNHLWRDVRLAEWQRRL